MAVAARGAVGVFLRYENVDIILALGFLSLKELVPINSRFLECKNTHKQHVLHFWKEEKPSLPKQMNRGTKVLHVLEFFFKLFDMIMLFDY